MTVIPDHVVIRHTCHCPRAAVRPAEGEPEEHVFTVDGEDFPWMLTERGPLVKRLADDLHSIDVEILLFDRDKSPVGFEHSVGATKAASCVPLLDGEPFPWAISADGYTLQCSRKKLPTLRLAFFARKVSGNLPVEECRGRAVWDVDGELIAEGSDTCDECGEPIDNTGPAMLAHYCHRHPEHVRVTH